MQKPSGNKKVLCFGEVLWDVLPDGKQVGGAPLNVAYHLRKHGVETAVISRIGDDLPGRQIREFMSEAGLSDAWIQTDKEHATSTVEAKLHADHEVKYDIIRDVAWDFIEYDSRQKDLANQSAYLVYGSLSTRNEQSGSTLFRLLDTQSIKVLDVNLRAPFYSEKTLRPLLMQAAIVKLNEAELGIISEWFGCNKRPQEQMRCLFDLLNLDILLVTCGNKGAFALDHEGVFFSPGYSVKVADTVGSGDAFLAGFLHQQMEGQTVETSLTFANRLAAFVATRKGGCPVYSLQDMERLLPLKPRDMR